MSNCNVIAYILPAGSSPVNNSINTTVKVDPGSSKRGTSDLYLARKYDIEPVAFASTATANVRLYFLQTEFDNFNLKATDSSHRLLPTGPADATGIGNLILRQFHGTGTAPGNYSGATQDFTTAISGFTVNWNATRNWWEVVVPVNGFSGFYITSQKAGPIPVKLEYINGSQSNNQHFLNWKVNCTSTEAKFEIERSSDGIHFAKVGEFSASQLRCAQPFDFTDAYPMPGINYYRVKIIDVDGKFYYSSIVALTSKGKGFEIISLNPNPVRDENAVIRINAGERVNANLVITDFTGRLINKMEVDIQTGINSIPLATKQLAAGAYQVTIYAPGLAPKTTKFIKQ
jgi:hypothetical protein